MLEQVRFTFTIKLFSFTHVGDGRNFTSDKVKTEKGESIKIAAIQRGRNNLPVIEAASIRGSIRAHLNTFEESRLAQELFGPEDIDKKPESDGAMRLHAGYLENAEEQKKKTFLLPYWNELENRPCSFMLPGIRIDRDSGVVEEHLLYQVEMLPDGCCFRFTGTFLGNENQFVEQAGAMFGLLAAEEGFEVGATTGYGNGRARLLAESVSYETRNYNAAEKKFLICNKVLTITPVKASGEPFTIQLTCLGPYFVLDPVRAKKDKTGNNSPDMLALMRDDCSPVFSGKMLLQDLRRRSAWLESRQWLENNAYDYDNWKPCDDVDRHLKNDESPASLTRTERLFGVTGWGKRVRVNDVAVDWQKAVHRAQGLKLDIFTQAPIDGALIEYQVPAGLAVKVSLRLEKTGLEAGDAEHFRDVLCDLASGTQRPRYCHTTGSGYGAFTAVVGNGGGV